MIHFARRASLVAVLLLASVGTASAECACVLWAHLTRVDRGYSRTGPLPKEVKKPVILEDEWVIVKVLDSRAVCDAALERDIASHRKHGWEPILSHASQPLFMDIGSTVSDGREWRCLPDTIDPRGPETK